MFLFNDTQVVEEVFLEDINNILSSGEVPNLYKPDELEEVCFITSIIIIIVVMISMVQQCDNRYGTTVCFISTIFEM